MISERVNYVSLKSEYSDPCSLSYKKIRMINDRVPNGGSLLDIGMGTGDLISLRNGKHDVIYGIDGDSESISICQEKFGITPAINIFQGDLGDFKKAYPGKFDCITCLRCLGTYRSKGSKIHIIEYFRFYESRRDIYFFRPRDIRKGQDILGDISYT